MPLSDCQCDTLRRRWANACCCCPSFTICTRTHKSNDKRRHLFCLLSSVFGLLHSYLPLSLSAHSSPGKWWNFALAGIYLCLFLDSWLPEMFMVLTLIVGLTILAGSFRNWLRSKRRLHAQGLWSTINGSYCIRGYTM